MKNQITKETVYRIPADVKRESAVTLQEKHLLQKFTNILREDGKNYWFNAERFLRTAEEYNFTVSSMMRDIELSEYVEEEEIPSLKTLRRLLNYCEYPDEKLVVGIQAIKRIGKALYGNQNAFLEIIDEESLSCMAEQYLKIREKGKKNPRKQKSGQKSVHMQERFHDKIRHTRKVNHKFNANDGETWNNRST